MGHYFFGANIGLFFDVLLDWIRSSGTSDSACRLVEPVFFTSMCTACASVVNRGVTVFDASR